MTTRLVTHDEPLTRRAALHRLAAVAAAPVAVYTGDMAEAAQGRVPAKRTISTVTGSIDPAKLGFTLSHEHVCASSAGMWQAWPQLFGGRAQFVKVAVDQLRQAKAEGIDSLIDVTTVDLGRDIRLLEEVSRKSGVQIVACTGHWLDPSRSMSARTVEELAEFFVREIERGIEGTDIRAGVIKVANGATIDPFGDKLLRAAARASKATGVGITTHSPGANRVGDKQAEIFASEGLDPSRVCIGHTDNSPADYQAGLIKRGYYLGMDQLPRGGPAPPGTPLQPLGALSWEERYNQIKQLVDAGFAARIMLGNDHSIAMSLQPTAADAARLAQNTDGMLFVSRKAIPALRKIGVPEQAIRTMSVDAPRRFLVGV
jgi:phosphotriesterase-related protein